MSMAWYKTETFEYISHTEYELELRLIADPNYTIIIPLDWLGRIDKIKRPAVYNGFLFVTHSYLHKALEIDMPNLMKIPARFFRNKTGKQLNLESLKKQLKTK